MHYTMGQTTPLPKTTAAEFHPLTLEAEVGGELAAGWRPTLLVEVRLQERIKRKTVEQIVDLAPTVQILDAHVPQVVHQPVDVLTLFDISVPE